MESTLTASETPGFLAGRPLDEWNAAYAKVESYFNALRVRNKLLLGQLVTRVLDRAGRRAELEPQKSMTALAVEEMDRLITDWYASVLDEPRESAELFLSTRGRLALLLADMPGQWQDQFLKPGPWPPDFVNAMRASYLRAGPEFEIAHMNPRPIDLGPIAALNNLGNFPYFRALLFWLVFAAMFVALFELTH